ncbi:hypothetical protein [Microbulbifer sp. HZ11]|uniref:hypothetical protein n=1 Tax=Microbulbifer sp. HZ11 TaxID=1453501 RepID=UPI0005BAB1E7|nr:hypothetical protein [Microbulbifer sp. HZ11]
MINSIWPKKLLSPKIDLGQSINDGIQIISKLESPVEESSDSEISYRVNTDKFDIAIYEKSGVISSVWHNDPIGRLWAKGKARKLKLYLARYGNLGDWELRLSNGIMAHYFNEKLGIVLVYGVHKDVIRVNLTRHA